MKAFAFLCNRLDENNQFTNRVSALVEYFEQVSNEERFWAIALFMNQRPQRVLSQKELKEWSASLCNLPIWLFETSLKAVGDLCETIALVLPESDNVSEEDLCFWIQHLKNLKGLDIADKKQGLQEALDLLTADEKYILLKLATGGFRMSIDQKTLATAISKLGNKSAQQIALRLTQPFSPSKNSFQDFFFDFHPDEEIGLPYSFHSCFYFEKNQPANRSGLQAEMVGYNLLGKPSQWLAESKWNGVRTQLILRTNKLFVWTNDGFCIGNKCPEFDGLKEYEWGDVVIDGELLAKVDGKILPVDTLKTRLKKQSVTKADQKKVPLFLMAYDLLEFKGNDIRTEKLSVRREKLSEVISKFSNRNLIQMSEEVAFNSWNDLASTLLLVRRNNAVGLVLKDKNSFYKTGREKGDWWKLKPAPMTITCVLLYVQSGGWGGGESNYTFAVKSNEQYIPIGKTIKGLTQEERKEINAFARKNTVERFGPVRSVKPELVFELTFEEITKSDRRKCGFVLKEPKVKAWLREEQFENGAAHSLDRQLSTLEEVRNFLELYE